MARCKGATAQTRRFNIAEQAVLGQPITILHHPACDCNTGCRRVTLFHPRIQNIDTLDEWIVKPIARVRWGDDCNGGEVEVDWKHGVILDLSGCYTEVALEFVELNPQGGSLPDEDNPFSFTAMSACCGAGAARGIATRTMPQVNLGPGGQSSIIEIPPFAYAVRFATPNPETFFIATTIIAQFSSGIASALDLVTADNIPEDGNVILVGGANRIAVVNNAVAGDLTFEPVFLIGV